MKSLSKNEMSQVSGGVATTEYAGAAILNPCFDVIKCYYNEDNSVVQSGSHGDCPSTHAETPSTGYKQLKVETAGDKSKKVTYLANYCTLHSSFIPAK